MSNREDKELAEAVCHLAGTMATLAHAIGDFGAAVRDEAQWRRSHERPATKSDLQELEKKLMSTNDEIIEYLKAREEYDERDQKSYEGLKEDMKAIKDALNAALNASGLSEETRARISAGKTAAQRHTEQLEALDKETPPVVPTPPEPTPAPGEPGDQAGLSSRRVR